MLAAQPSDRWLGKCASGAGLISRIRIFCFRPHAFEAYEKSGCSYFVSIFFAAMVVTMMPITVGTIFACKVFNMNPLMVLGAIAGAQSCTPGLNALREASGSNIGALAYTVPYAIGNILLIVWGAVVAAIMYAIRN